ncbi:MAG TPA: hypothetical protein VFA70_12490 [Dehalococcoidia bacterium]|nr:hypothetical protein [Dehalococcoidia bacterium]
MATSTVAPSATTTPPAPAQTAAPAASAQTAAPSPTATAAPSAASGAGNGVDPNTLLDAIKLTSADLPAGFSLGALTSTEQNAQAVDGFDDPQSALSLMNSTGRQIGLVQQVSTPDSSSGAGISIEVWQDDTGAKAWMDSYPAPESDLSPQRLTPPQTVGDQTILYRFNQNGTIIYSMTWRRGRVVLGVGEPFGSDAGAIEKLMQLVNILDAKAVAALKGG